MTATTTQPASLVTLYLSHLASPTPTTAPRRATARPCSASCVVPPIYMASDQDMDPVPPAPRRVICRLKPGPFFLIGPCLAFGPPRPARGDVPTSRLALPVRSSTRLEVCTAFLTSAAITGAPSSCTTKPSHLGSLIALTTSRHDTAPPFTSRPAATASPTQPLDRGHVTHSSVATRSSLRPPVLPYARGFKPPCFTLEACATRTPCTPAPPDSIRPPARLPST